MSEDGTIQLTLPMRTVNPLNNRRHWRTVWTRSKKERGAVALELLSRRPLPRLPVVVTLTRLSRGEMDTDGLAASFKAVRDGIADAYGIGDGARSGLTFNYAQAKAKTFGVEIRIAPSPKGGAGETP